MTLRSLTKTILIALVLAVSVVGLTFAITNGVFVSGTVPVDAPNGPQVDVEVSGEVEMDLTNPITDSNTVHVITEDGDVELSSQGTTDVDVQSGNLEGTETSVTNLDVTSNELTINPADKPAASIEGDLDAFDFRDAQLDDGTVDFTFDGSSGTSNVTIRGIPADTAVGAVDGSGSLLQAETTDSSGTLTFTGLQNNGETDVELVTSDGGPELSNPSPDGLLNSSPSEMSVDVSDPDFSSDNVDIEFRLDGSQIDAQTVSSNQTVTTSIPSSGTTGGSHSYLINVEDEYGETDSISGSYSVPDTLFLRNETNPSELIDAPVDTEVSFFADDGVHNRATDSGEIDLTGLPVDEDFVVEVQPSQDFHGRTVVIDSIYAQQDIYLLHESEDSVETRFTLNDPTGQYDSSSYVFVSKPLQIGGETQFQTIYSDSFGVEGATAILQEGERYQIRIETGDRQTVQEIGPYRAASSENVQVRPGSPTITLDEYQQGWAADAQINNQTLEFVYDDPENLTNTLDVSVHEQGNEANSLGPPQTYTDLGEVSGTFALTANESELTWVVEFDVTRDGEQFTTTATVTKRPDLVPGLSDGWRLVIGIGIMLVSAGVFSVLNVGVGAVVVAIQGGILWWTGWLGGATTGVGVVIALFVAVLVHIYRSSGP